MMRLLLMLPSLMLLQSAAQAAQTPEGRGLSYEDALSEAETANPEIRIAESDIAAAQGGVLVAQAAWDPLVTGSLGSYRNLTESFDFGLPGLQEVSGVVWDAQLAGSLPTGTGWSFGVDGSRTDFAFTPEDQDVLFESEQPVFSTKMALGLSQQVLRGWKMAYNLRSVDAAQRGLTQAEAGRLATRQDVLSRVASAYWDLVGASQAKASSAEALELAREEARIVEAQVGAGNMAPVERTRVAAAVAQAEIALIEATNQVGSASDQLAVLLAWAPGELIQPVTLPGAVPPDLDIGVEDAVEAALAGNVALQLQRLQSEAASADLEWAQHGRLPELSLNASYGLRGDLEDSYGAAAGEMFQAELLDRYIGASVSAPILNRAARGQVESAAGAVLRAQLDLEALERSVAQQIAALVRTLDNARSRVQLAELNLRLAQETLAAEKALQAAGRAIQKDVLEAQRAITDGEVSLIMARTDYRKALVQLQALQGQL